MKQIEKQIELSEIKTVAEFANLYLARFHADQKEQQNGIKLFEIVKYLNKRTHYFTPIFSWINRRGWFEAPPLESFRHIIDEHRVIKTDFLVKREDGEMVCNDCDGKGGHLRSKKIRGTEYDCFYPCETCKNGLTRYNSHFENYLSL